MRKDRPDVILGLLREKSFRSIEELCEAVGVSPATIRRDLSSLENQGYIIRVNGGAILSRRTSDGPEVAPDPYLEEKKRIAAAAVEMVSDGDTVFMDAGSTNNQIADLLIPFSNITIVTNSLQIAQKFVGRKDISVIVCGGTLGEANPSSIVGPVAEAMISGFRANICFLGTLGIHLKQGITDSHLSAARIKQKMIESSNHVVLAIDRSKFGRSYTYFVCSTDKMDHIITDSLAPKEYVDLYRNQGIPVTLV